MNSERNQLRVLNAGAGSTQSGRLHSVFASPDWSEVRLDIDPLARPELVASIVDMRADVPDASFDAVWSSHTIEHLHAHEVIPAFREFRRVLKSDGFALVTCPDLASIARLAATGDVESIVYHSPSGPIRAIDMLYGHGRAIGEGHLAMAHNTGFTATRLGRVGLASGFADVRVLEGPNFDLWAALLAPEADIARLAAMFAGANVASLFAHEGPTSREADASRLAAAG